MSLVMSIVMQDCIAISGDLRAVNAENESDKIDGVRKIYAINDKVVVGLAGDVKVIFDLLRHLKSENNKKRNVQAVALFMRKWLKQAQKEDKELHLDAHVIGEGDGKKLTLIELNHADNYRMTKVIPSSLEAKWRVMYSNEPAEPILAKKFEELTEYTPESIASILIEVNEEVASKDDFVSKECEVITLPNKSRTCLN